MFRVAGITASIGVALTSGCGVVQQRFPDDVQTSFAHRDMRKLETDRFIIYYAAERRAEVDRFLVRADRCAESYRRQAVLPPRGKMVIAMPDVPFNNAFVMPEALGYEHVSVIPTTATLDFATEFGLPPDPGLIACHELVHYTQFEQIDGLWDHLDSWFGSLWTPQLGYDAWFDEGIATHYEAKVSPQLGRPNWPLFTGMFAAAYADEHMSSGDMSQYGRLSSVGHHYLVGTMFVRFLTERYGERPLWTTIADHASAWTGLFWTGSFHTGFGKPFGELFDEFDDWKAKTFPHRDRPANQRVLATAGNDARYARGADGTEAWIANDVDVAPHLVVRDAAGIELADIGLVDIVPPRTLVTADPLTVSGLSITADGADVYLTMIDLAATFQVTRLLRWHRGDHKLSEVTSELGPGATIDPTGSTYYYCAVDGDRWSLAAYDVRTHARRTITQMTPGTYILGAQVSRDGNQLVANVWDGTAFVAWIVDAHTGQRIREIRGPAQIYDASFTDDGRVVYLGATDGRFQIFIDGQLVSNVPYAALAPRVHGTTIRFLDREHWNWELAELPLPPAATASETKSDLISQRLEINADSISPAVRSDEPFSVLDHLFYAQVRAPTLVFASSELPHAGITLGGGDRLGLQRWSVSGYVQAGSTVYDKALFGADAGYLNTMLAPWSILATAGFLDWVDPVSTDDPKTKLAELRRTRDAQLTLARTWRGTIVTALSGVFTDDLDRVPDLPDLRRHLGGPALELDYYGYESTPYVVRRGLAGSLRGAYYPHQLSTFDGDIADVGGSLQAIVPLPWLRRHTIRADVRGRALLSRDDTGLLQLGGDSGLGAIYNGSNIAETPSYDDSRFPPNLRFIELLRGYEDYAITTDRVAIGDVTWSYPLIIDRGVANTLWALPSSFLREIDLELFADGAIDRRHDTHAAGGAAVTLRMQLLRIPLLVQYQIARRLRDDRAITQLVGIGPDL